MTDARPLLSEIARLKAELADANDALTIAYMLGFEKAKDEIARLKGRVSELEKMDSEAAKHVESVICLRTGFTGEPPYVGWEGLGLALREALDDADASHAEIARLKAELADAREHDIRTKTCMGVGDGAGQLFVYGDHAAIIKAQAMVIACEEFAKRYVEMKAELAAAEEATRKALEAIPIAMDAAVEKEREASARRVCELESLLAKATRFDVGCVCVESRGEGFWAVTDCGGVYAADGEWEFEPAPSSRSELFFARTRFPFDQAMKLAEKVSAPISAVEKEGRDG